jgi:hypothetical protein
MKIEQRLRCQCLCCALATMKNQRLTSNCLLSSVVSAPQERQLQAEPIVQLLAKATDRNEMVEQ